MSLDYALHCARWDKPVFQRAHQIYARQEEGTVQGRYGFRAYWLTTSPLFWSYRVHTKQKASFRLLWKMACDSE